MSFPKSQKFEHVALYVNDVVETAAFYRDVVGMVDIAEESGTIYLGFGLDDNYDIALREGDPAVDHFAIRMDSQDDVERFERRLSKANVEYVRSDGQEPNQDVGLRFALPSGHEMELVSVTDKRYLNVARPARERAKGIRPLDTCHINIMTSDVKPTVDFVCEVLDFKLSEVVEPEPGDWLMGFARLGYWHHDIGFIRGDQSLHHLAVAMESFEHIKRACDELSAHGVAIEVGPSRHPVAANLYIYVKMPGGHRWEFSAEMAQLENDTPPVWWEGGLQNSLDAWGDLHTRLPEGFVEGSG